MMRPLTWSGDFFWSHALIEASAMSANMPMKSMATIPIQYFVTLEKPISESANPMVETFIFVFSCVGPELLAIISAPKREPTAEEAIRKP